MVTLPRLPGIERFTAAELRELVRVADAVKVSPRELAVVIYLESSFRADAKNPSGSASGLLQWTEKVARSLGTTTADIRLMSVMQQLALTQKHLAKYGARLRVIGDVYIANSLPHGLGHPDEYVLAEAGSEFYERNTAWDTDHDGAITNGDLRRRVLNTLAVMPMTVVVPTVTERAQDVGGTAFFVAAALYIAWKVTR